QGVLVAAIEPRKSSLPIEHRDDQHFHRRGRGEEAREQADDERDTAGELDDQRRPDPGKRRIESLLHETADIGRGPTRDLAPTVHQQIPTYREAHDRPGERYSEVIERRAAGKQQLGFVLGFRLDACHRVFLPVWPLLARPQANTVGWAKAHSAYISADPRCRAWRSRIGRAPLRKCFTLHRIWDTNLRSGVAGKPQTAAIRAETLDCELIVTRSAPSGGRTGISLPPGPPGGGRGAPGVG